MRNNGRFALLHLATAKFHAVVMKYRVQHLMAGRATALPLAPVPTFEIERAPVLADARLGRLMVSFWPLATAWEQHISFIS